MTKEYETRIYNNPNKIAILFIIFSLGLIFLFVYIGRHFNYKLFGFWMSILVLITPFFLIKKVRKISTNKVILSFDEDSFSISEYSLESDELIKKQTFIWSNVSGYKFYFSYKLTTSLILFLKDKTKKSFNFLDNKSYDESVKSDSVFSIFYSFVKRHNYGDQKIIPYKSFFATTAAKFIIIFEALLIVIAFILHIIFHSFSNSLYLLLAVGFLIPQLINRSQNLSMYKKIKNLN